MSKAFEEGLSKCVETIQDIKKKGEKQPLTDEQKRARAHLVRLLNADFSHIDSKMTITYTN